MIQPNLNNIYLQIQPTKGARRKTSPPEKVNYTYENKKEKKKKTHTSKIKKSKSVHAHTRTHTHTQNITNKNNEISDHWSLISLNINGLNFFNKRHRLTE